MIISCAMCGKQMNRQPSRIKKNINCFCSKDCKDKHQRRGKEIPCVWCGRFVYKFPSQQTARNFCCQACRLKWLGQNNIENINVAGHSAGHKAPHLTLLNQQRNPAGSLSKNTVYVSSKVYRRIVEKAMGRKLMSDEVVHHINGDRTDNCLENLLVMKKHEHHILHMRFAVERFSKGVVENVKR